MKTYTISLNLTEQEIDNFLTALEIVYFSKPYKLTEEEKETVDKIGLEIDRTLDEANKTQEEP